MKYKKLTGIILKKQNYREADVIVTAWTRQAGKVRFIAKSLRLPKSKLNFALQDLSEVELDLTGNHLPTLIGARPVKQFQSLHKDLKKIATAFYSAELMLKMTADEHPNSAAYETLRNFLKELDQLSEVETYQIRLDKFCLELLDILGFRIPEEKDLTHKKINKFIEYIIERNIKSEPFLISI